MLARSQTLAQKRQVLLGTLDWGSESTCHARTAQIDLPFPRLDSILASLANDHSHPACIGKEPSCQSCSQRTKSHPAYQI